MLRSEEKMVFLGGVPCKQVCWIDVDSIQMRESARHAAWSGTCLLYTSRCV